MKIKLDDIKKYLGKNKNIPVTLKFTTCGIVMINDLPFTFGVENIGAASSKGVCIAISGDEEELKKLTLTTVEAHIIANGNQHTISAQFELKTKADGKPVYQAKFDKLKIPAAKNDEVDSKDEAAKEKSLKQNLKNDMTFKFTPRYKENDDIDVMLTVYPYDNLLGGAVSLWKSVTADENSFEKYYKLAKKKL